MAIIATLIFTISFPAAVQAQTLAPAPSPTSDGNFLSLSLSLFFFLDLIYYTRSIFLDLDFLYLHFTLHTKFPFHVISSYF